MAKRTVNVPITRSSNTGGTFVRSYWWCQDDPPFCEWAHEADQYYGAITSYLRIQNVRGFSKKRAGLSWDIPATIDVNLINKVELVVYASNGGSDVTIMDRDFVEGETIQGGNVLTGYSLQDGWNYIDLERVPKYDSVTIEATDEIRDGDYINTLEIHSHRNSSNKPYVRITYSDTPPKPPSSLTPNRETLNPRGEILFAWSHNAVGGAFQKAFELQYQVDNGNWQTVKQSTPRQTYTMPASTLPAEGDVQWRVRTTDTNDETSEWSYASFSLGILPQQAPIAFAPSGSFIDENEDVKFEWAFLGGSSGEKQKKFTLQYSTDNAKTWTTVNETTSRENYTVKAGTFKQGNVVWRVKTTNNFDEESPYSVIKSFMIIGIPTIPIITNITNQSRPVITWEHINQKVYELIILDNEDNVVYDTGIVPNPLEKEIKVPIYLNDGVYKVKIRIANEFNLFSEFAERIFEISTQKPKTPLIEVFNNEYSITIRTDVKDDLIMVYRDDIFIGVAKNGVFEDYTCRNRFRHKYIVRRVDKDDNFSDSDYLFGRCSFSGDTISLADSPNDFMKMKVALRTDPRKSETLNIQAESNFYDGRQFPILEYSNFETLDKSYEYQISTKEELDKLKNLIRQKKTLLMRLNDGDIIYGSIQSLSTENNLFGYEVRFSISKTKDDDYVKIN